MATRYSLIWFLAGYYLAERIPSAALKDDRAFCEYANIYVR